MSRVLGFPFFTGSCVNGQYLPRLHFPLLAHSKQLPCLVFDSSERLLGF